MLKANNEQNGSQIHEGRIVNIASQSIDTLMPRCTFGHKRWSDESQLMDLKEPSSTSWTIERETYICLFVPTVLFKT
jgi:hypothetical protein